MSIKMMSKVWDSRLAGNHKLLCLFLADCGNDNGDNIFPGVETTAYRATVSSRTAQRIIHDLVDNGIIKPVGKTARGTISYHLSSEALAAYRGDKLSPIEKEVKIPDMSPEGDTYDTPGVTQLCRRGGDTAMSPEPLINQELNHQLTRYSNFSKNLEFFQTIPDIQSGTWTAKNLWSAVYGQLKLDMSRSSFDTWVKNSWTAGYTKIDDEIILTVIVPNEFARSWIDTRLKTTINRIIAGCTGGKVSGILLLQGEAAEVEAI